MKKSPDSAFKLIKSMTIAEKRYVKRDLNKYASNRENYNMQLFDALNSLEEYDEIKLLKKIKSAKLKKNFRVQKQHLFDAVLNSLRAHEALTDMEMQLYNQLGNAEILNRRGLLEEALVVINKTLEKSRKYEFYLIWMEALWLKHDAMQGLGRNKNYVEEIKNTFKELADVATINSQYIDARFYNAAFYFLKIVQTIHSTSDAPELLELKEKNEENALVNSVKVRQLYLTNKIQFHGLERQYDAFVKVAKEALLHIEQSYLKEAAPVAYFIAFSQYLQGLKLTEQYTELVVAVNKWIEALKGDYWTENVRIRSIVSIRAYYRILELLEMVPPKSLDEELPFDLEQAKIYDCAYSELSSLIEYHFVKNNYNQVLELIEQQDSISSMPIYVMHSKRNKLLQVIIYFEQNNLISLVSAVDKAKYFHKKNNIYTETEMIFLNRFNKDYDSQIEQFLPVYNQWNDLETQHPFVKLWLESKIHQTTVLEAYKTKMYKDLTLI